MTLETFGPQHGLKLLAAQMKPSFDKYSLPTNIYPFTEEDVTALCSKATSPRSFIQGARTMFESWLDEVFVFSPPVKSGAPAVLRRDDLDSLIRLTMNNFEREHLSSYDSEIPIEQDLFGRVKNVVETLLKHSAEKVTYEKATCRQKVMPPNLILKPAHGLDSLCIGIVNGEATSFAARMRNINEVLRSGEGPRRAVLL